MRSHHFLEYLITYGNFPKMAEIAIDNHLHGGWEVWAQLEMYRHISNCERGTIFIERERAYRDNERTGRKDICDFVIKRAEGDDTYIELKCILPQSDRPLADLSGRFAGDIDKVKRNRLPSSFCLAIAVGSIANGVISNGADRFDLNPHLSGRNDGQLLSVTTHHAAAVKSKKDIPQYTDAGPGVFIFACAPNIEPLEHRG